MKSLWFWFVGFIALMLFLLGGCQSVQPKNFDEAMALIDKAATVARAQGIAYSADLRFNGPIAAGLRHEVYLDTGIFLGLHFQGNASQGDGSETESND
jgi:hypothetical protein